MFNENFIISLLPQLRTNDPQAILLDGDLQFSPIVVREDYRKKWNIYPNDFICLTKGGELVRPTLYRVGGLGTTKPGKDRYLLLMKHVEAHYEDSITKDPLRKPHLESRWCILDRHGNEKVEFSQFKSPYLIKDSVIYSIESKYYNIETGEFYCYSSKSMQSSEFLFLESNYYYQQDADKSKEGVMKINKKTGEWEVFK